VILSPEQVITGPEQVITSPEQVITGPEQVITGPEQVTTDPEQVITGKCRFCVTCGYFDSCSPLLAAPATVSLSMTSRSRST